MKKRKLLYFVIAIVVIIGMLFNLVPKPPLLDNFSFSTAVYDRSDNLLRLTLSRDDKYRFFTPIKDIPPDVINVLLLYEDKNFYYHLGIDPLALTRAIINMATKGRRQGASTITMQVARLVYHINSTSVLGKIEQMLRALQIEMFYSKREILEAYFNLAPYGGNVEGIGAASLVYFHQNVEKLSLPEIMSLTVIPQNPSKRNPATKSGHAQIRAAQQRLAQMWINKYPTSSGNIYLDMPIAMQSLRQLPYLAPHYVNQVLESHRGEVHSSLDLGIQNSIENILRKYVKRNNNKGVYNASALLLDFRDMQVVAQVGSSEFFNATIQGQVDGTRAQRSPGSAMKPFIYGLALEKGIIHPLTMLKDLPRNFHFYTPENFDSSWSGIMSATFALVYSRNIPAISLLQRIKVDALHNLLVASNVKRLRDKDFYGLALALGGFEISLQEMTRLYAMLANYGEQRDLVYVPSSEKPLPTTKALLSPESSYLTLQMLGYNVPVDKKVFRINTLSKNYPVYWKTGTSYSYKDAVSIGVFGPYVLAVWIGNFDGTPNHSFVGRTMAAPLFFEIVRSLEKNSSFDYAISSVGLNIAEVDICKSTGDIADNLCPSSLKSWFIPGVSPIKMSDVHRRIPIDVKTGNRACRHTPPVTVMRVYEFWPSDIARAFIGAGIHRRPPPNFAEDCSNIGITPRGKSPEIIFPVAGLVHAVRSHKLKDEKIMLKANVDSDASKIYWFLNEALLGTSKPDEVLEISAKLGVWNIKAVDNLGRVSSQKLSVMLVD